MNADIFPRRKYTNRFICWCKFNRTALYYNVKISASRGVFRHCLIRPFLNPQTPSQFPPTVTRNPRQEGETHTQLPAPLGLPLPQPPALTLRQLPDVTPLDLKRPQIPVQPGPSQPIILPRPRAQPTAGSPHQRPWNCQDGAPWR